MKFINNLRFLIICLSVLFTTNLVAETISSSVDGGISYGKVLQCTAYLHIPEQAPHNNNLPIYFYEAGTGLYTMSTFEGFDGNNNNNLTYTLTMNKPGVSPDPKDPSSAVANRDFFDFYTMDTLIECAKNALIWAENTLNDNLNRNIILQGHSEGSVVMTKLAYNILSNSISTLSKNQLKGLILSGVVMDKFTDVLSYQLSPEEYKLYLQNYNNGHFTQAGDDYFYNTGKTGWYWIDNAVNANYVPLTQVFQNISKLENGRTLPIEIFQGLNDKEVSPTSVLKFETDNDAKSSEQQLSVFARYYNSGHTFINPSGQFNKVIGFDWLNTIQAIAKANTKN